MIFMSDRISVAFSFSRRAHLLTTPKGRWYCLRQLCALRGGCGFCGSLMDNATTRLCCCHCAVCFDSSSKQLFPFWKQLAACLRKSATGSFVAAMGIASSATPIFFLRKRNKNKNERTVRTNGDLSLRS